MLGLLLGLGGSGALRFGGSVAPQNQQRPTFQAFENVVFNEKYVIFNNEDVKYTFEFMPSS